MTSSQSEKLGKDDLVKLHGDDYVEKFKSNREIYIKRLSNILEHVNFSKNDNVADYGCGNGQLFELIHDKIGSYSGIDFSASFILAFKNILEEGNFAITPNLYCEDIVAFSQEHKEEFDKVFTLDFSEHIYDEDFVKIYSAIYVSLKKGGELILHTPNGNFFLEWMRNNGILKQRQEHIAVRNAKKYLPLLKEVGFDQVEVINLPHYNVLKYLHVFTYLPFCGKYFRARLLLKCIK